MMKKILFILICCIILCGGFLLYLGITYPTASPFTSLSYFFEARFHPHKTFTKQIVGFLPYWRTDDVQYIQFPLVSEINYFSLPIDDQGNFVQVVNNQTNPGWVGWQSQTIKDVIAHAQITGNKFTVTITNQRNGPIERFLASEAAQDRLITHVIDLIRERHINGVIIDFEYTGDPDLKYQTLFTQFAKQLSVRVKAVDQNVSVSLTLLPLSGRDHGLFDLPKLAGVFDRFIGMTYDYYTPSSDIAGPIAPLHGFAEKKYFFDVATAYADYLKFLPKEKILMGVPYYGYDFPVTDGPTIKSTLLTQNDTNGYVAIMSYGRFMQDKSIPKNKCMWEPVASETWCWYVDQTTGKDHQIWVPDNKSLGASYDFLIKQGLDGIAIWTIGLDKETPTLWNLLEKTFSK